MGNRYSRRATVGLVSLAVSIAGPVVGTSPEARAQTAADCYEPNEFTPEKYGPTDISATTGNQRLSVAINSEGTVTVFKWPSPSFYDQIKYRTTDRSLPYKGALPNEGALIGLAWSRAGGSWNFSWLRFWRHQQTFADDDSDEVVTTFTKGRRGLKVVVRDVVTHDANALVRSITVKRTVDSPVRRARIITFANFNPVYSKLAQAPVQDWCFEEQNDEGATYLEQEDAVVHSRSGVDESTGRSSSVAVTMGFDQPSTGHQVAPDSYENPGSGTNAYDDAADGSLTGSSSSSGQTDAALSYDMDLSEARLGHVQAILTAGATEEDALATLQRVRPRSAKTIAQSKAQWWREWLSRAWLPRGAPTSIVRLAKRSLITLRQAIDASTPEVDPEEENPRPGGLIVRSIATQSPYGLDWIRDGAYANHALDLIGHEAIVDQHNLRYANLQMEAADSLRGGPVIPPGNWHQNYYADGVVGGPVPYEIDATGYGMWTLWDHYEVTRHQSYLLSPPIYEAIQRAAQYLSDTCRDPATGLQCVAHEGDDPNPSRTLKGAITVWMGLNAAAQAARVNQATANAEKWEARRDELRAAIEREFFDEDCTCYTRDPQTGGTLLWPVGLLEYGSKRANAQARINWREIEPAFEGRRAQGQFEVKALLGNAYAWAGDRRKLRLVRRGLQWVADVAASGRTGILGEAWMRYPPPRGPYTTMVSQPHVPQQTMFYLAALKAFGKARYSFD